MPKAFTAQSFHDGEFVITGSRGSECGPNIWELKTGRRIASRWNKKILKYGQAVTSLTASPDSEFLFMNGIILPDSNDYVSLKYDLRELTEPVDKSLEELRTIGELTASKHFVGNDTDNLRGDAWLDRWNSLINRDREARILRLEKDSKH